MISVGIDVSKEKSTICILKPYGEIVMKPRAVQHTETELAKLTCELQMLQDEVRVVMEATGTYHLPILSYLKERIVVFAKEVMILMLSQYFFAHINKKCDIMKNRR